MTGSGPVVNVLTMRMLFASPDSFSSMDMPMPSLIWFCAS
jgi:hypothetical protein